MTRIGCRQYLTWRELSAGGRGRVITEDSSSTDLTSCFGHRQVVDTARRIHTSTPAGAGRRIGLPMWRWIRQAAQDIYLLDVAAPQSEAAPVYKLVAMHMLRATNDTYISTYTHTDTDAASGKGVSSSRYPRGAPQCASTESLPPCCFDRADGPRRVRGRGLVDEGNRLGWPIRAIGERDVSLYY